MALKLWRRIARHRDLRPISHEREDRTYLPSTLHTPVCVTIVCMQVDRLSITMDPDLGKSVREAAARSGSSVSAWLAAAAAERLRNELLGAALDAWEADSAPFSDKELDAAARVLGVSRHVRGSAA